MHFDDLIRKVRDNQRLSQDQIIQMLDFAPDSRESYRLTAEANLVSKALTGNKAEVHAQLALNKYRAVCR